MHINVTFNGWNENKHTRSLLCSATKVVCCLHFHQKVQKADTKQTQTAWIKVI